MSKEATLICGDRSVFWEDLVIAAECLSTSLLPVGPAIGYNMPILMDRHRNIERGAGYLGLLDLLHLPQQLKCTDARDKVYGVLGMAYRHPDPWLEVDYSLSVSEIFLNTALSILHGESGFDILAVVRHPKRVASLPSWAPDWTSPLPHRFYVSGNKWYRASGHETGTVSVEVSRDRTSITSDGILVGSIQEVSRNLPSTKDFKDGEELEYLQTKAEVFTQWRTFALRSNTVSLDSLAYCSNPIRVNT
jgi:hypothetical protein